jgi:D-aminopeptidase
MGMMQQGKHNRITDIEGLKVGNAEDRTLKSGVTVLTADSPFTAAASIMGGAPGSRETPLLEADKLVSDIDAIVLSGGSAFGLDAAGGVVEGLRQAGRGFVVGLHHVPIVPAAIIFDLNNGGNKDWVENPYPDLGAAALDGADSNFDLGNHGAGTGALTGDVKGGLGSASLVLEDGLTVAALAVVNALGSPLVPGQDCFWAGLDEINAEFGGLGAATSHQVELMPETLKLDTGHGNTTIAIVATDACLDKAACHRLAISAHDGMARALRPSHTLFDGDCVFALSTNRGKTVGPTQQMQLGHAAAICLSRAISRGVWEARTEADDIMPTAQNIISRDNI